MRSQAYSLPRRNWLISLVFTLGSGLGVALPLQPFSAARYHAVQFNSHLARVRARRLIICWCCEQTVHPVSRACRRQVSHRFVYRSPKRPWLIPAWLVARRKCFEICSLYATARLVLSAPIVVPKSHAVSDFACSCSTQALAGGALDSKSPW